MSLAELAALVERIGVPSALERVPAWSLPPELLELRWAWIIAQSYRMHRGGLAPREVKRVELALEKAWEVA
jgi:hypothetical protein